MTDAHSSGPQTTPLSVAAKIGWAILIVATLYVCYFSHLGAIGFVGPDEPRYAWIARDMTETGDWVTPRLYGKPWFEKPPLFYWGAAISFKLFGVSEAAARLPSAICALMATLALAWLAWRMYGSETTRWLLLLLPTTVGMIGFSHAAATDMPFSGMLTIAMVCAAVILRLTPAKPGITDSVLAGPSTPDSALMPSPQASASSATRSQTPWLALVLFGFFLGLAVLAKGPAAIILCGGEVFFWALFTKRWRGAFRLLHPAAIAAFCATALPWYILCARRNPDFFHMFIVEHNFKRFLTPEFQHIQPFWFYAPVVLVAVLPWAGALLWSAALWLFRIVRDRQISERSAFCAAWAMFCLLFFSASQSKLPGYILPAFPAICLGIVHRCFGESRPDRRGLRAIHLVSASIFLALSGALGFFGSTRHEPSQASAIAAAVVIGLFGLSNLAIAAFSLNRPYGSLRGQATAVCVLPVLISVLLANRLLPMFFFSDPSGKTIAREIQQRTFQAQNLFVQGMHRGQMYSLSFYLGKEVRPWDKDRPSAGYLLMNAKLCRSVVPETWSCGDAPTEFASSGEFLYEVRAKPQ